MSHTKEPWICRDGQNYNIGTSEGYAIADPAFDYSSLGSEELKANARRVVVCVNACAGIDTKRLDSLNAFSSDEQVGGVEWLENAMAIEINALTARIQSAEKQRAGWDGRKQQVEDLSALAARLARALRKAAPEHNLPALAMDYLQREGLCGSPLRDAPNA